MKKGFKIAIVIIDIVLLLAIITGVIDYRRIKDNKAPIFTIKLASEEEGKITYIGLGYKVIGYWGVSIHEPFENNMGLKFGSWFMKYEGSFDKDNENKDTHFFFGKVIEKHTSYVIVEPNEDEKERKSADKFLVACPEDDTVCEVGTYVKITYEGMIRESYPAQIDVLRIEKVPQIESTSNMYFKIERYNVYDSIKYYPYDEYDEGTIYFAGDIKEFYIILDKTVSLKEYMLSSDKGFFDHIKFITDKLDKEELSDGTKVYSSKELDVSITVCNTKTKNIYFDRYQSEKIVCG